jgi:hypothetical protein
MWVFLIPVILLAGATFAGGALDTSSKTSAAPANPTSHAPQGRKLPANEPLPFDPPYRQR